MLGSGAGAAGTVASWLGGGGQLVLIGTLSALTALMLISLLLLLCAGCQGQKKTITAHPGVDNENLMNGVSERDTFSQSVDSPGTDVGVSTSHNGPLTSGTVLTDTQDISPQPSEELVSSQTELRSSKCPQGRELPSIPPNSALIDHGASGDGTYEVVKEMAAASRDVSVEDSLYETVREMKDPHAPLELPNGTTHAAPPPPLLNGHASPCTPERGPLCAGVEYASVDLNKKSRYSADMEARRRSDNAGLAGARRAAEEPEDLPPPLPEKVLDENDNQPGAVVNGYVGATLHNGELPSPLSPSPGLDNHIMSDNEFAVYSTVNKSNRCSAENDEDKEHDYSSIGEINGLVPASSSSDLYATLRDIYPQPDGPKPGEEPVLDGLDPGYETICVPKAPGGAEDGPRPGMTLDGSDAAKAEPDYESVAELGLNRETSRL